MSVLKMDPFQQQVQGGQEALERYIQLEEEIAQLEASSPTTLLKQKRELQDQLTEKVKKQEQLVQTLEEET